MQDYKRIVSYIHTYENNEKKKNVGFGKLEARGGIGKLSVQINGQSMLEGRAFSVYFLRIAEYADGIRLGDCRVVQGRINAEFRFNTEDIMRSGLSLSKVQGIYITTDESPYAVFASSWTEAEIVPDRFRREGALPEAEIKEEKEATIEQEGTGQETEPEAEKETVSETQTEIQAETETVQVAVIANAEMPEVSEDSLLASFMESLSQFDNFNEQTELENIMDEAEAVEVSESEEEEKEVTDNAISDEMLYQMELDSVQKTPWEELCSKYPKVIAFEGARQPHRMCLKIDLKDLESIIGRRREISENTYLIRCYYKYRYLLLIENDNDPEGKSCLLGIPGTYCRNEGSLAGMFGYEEFYPARVSENMNGRFGYWCKEIVL